MEPSHNNALWIDEDRRLMRQCSRGNRTAFAALYRKYYPVIVSYLTSNNGCVASCEDLAQTVFLRIWEQRSSFQAQSSAKTYILGIARNVLNEYRRHNRKENAVGNVGEIPAHHDDPGTKELLEAVRHAKSQLSDKQRQALDIALHSHLTPREAASVLNCSENVYRQRLYDAKKRLKKFLGDFLVEF